MRTGSHWLLSGLLLLSVGVPACDEYASREQLQQVQQTVDAVQDQQQQVVTESRKALHGFDNRVEAVEARQAATEAAFSQMGSGFNVLTESVSQAYNASEKVAKQQVRHEREATKLLARVAPRLPEVDATVWLLGRPLSFSQLPQKQRLWLQLTPQGGTLYTARGDLSLRSETVGNRLYGIPDTGDVATICLTLLEGKPESGAFTAARCDQALQLYSFATTDPPAFSQ